MPEFKAALNRLNDSTWEAITSRRDKLTGRKVAAPPMQPLQQELRESRFSDKFPVLDYLDPALALAAEHELADIAAGFAAIVSELRWSQNPTYDETNCTPEFLHGYAYAALTGPDAPIRCAVPRGGIFIMAPGLTYPGHSHEPREVYLILTPGASWRLDDGDWFGVNPGDMIFHESWQIHAMRSGSEPLLAFAGWLESGSRHSISWGDGENRN